MFHITLIFFIQSAAGGEERFLEWDYVASTHPITNKTKSATCWMDNLLTEKYKICAILDFAIFS